MTREWPAGEDGARHAGEHATSHASLFVPVALLVAAFVMVAALDGPSDPLSALVLVLALLSLLAIALPVLESSPPVGRPSPGTTHALLAAADAIGAGEDPGVVAGRLGDVDVPDGRPRLCLDVAVRCIEGAGRCDRLEGRLRREAAGWLRLAFEEMNE